MIVNRYIFKNLFLATVFIAVTLAAVIFLTQSLRFLELVINSGASGGAFWMLTMLALPRFFEIILPIALMAGIIFTYNRMTADSELVVMRGLGLSPLQQAKPALVLAGIVYTDAADHDHNHRTAVIIKHESHAAGDQGAVFSLAVPRRRVQPGHAGPDRVRA
jgi:hypothetical protein